MTEATTFYASNAAFISAAAAPGDTIIVLTNGTWNNASISFKKLGTLANPITLKAQVQGQVLLTGNSRLFIGGTNLVVDGLVFTNGSTSQSSDIIAFRTGSSSLAKNCRLTNTSLIDLNPSSDSTDYKWVSLYGTSNRVDHCRLRGKNHSGATVTVWLPTSGQPNDHLIDHNLFENRSFSGSNGGESMRVGDSNTSTNSSRTIVESNLFNNCSGDVEIISSKSCDNIYRYNTFVSSQGCLVFRHGKRCSAIGNFFFGMSSTAAVSALSTRTTPSSITTSRTCGAREGAPRSVWKPASSTRRSTATSRSRTPSSLSIPSSIATTTSSSA